MGYPNDLGNLYVFRSTWKLADPGVQFHATEVPKSLRQRRQLSGPRGVEGSSASSCRNTSTSTHTHTYIYIYIIYVYCNHPEVDRKQDLQRKVHFSDFSENVWKFHIHPYSIYSRISIFIDLSSLVYIHNNKFAWFCMYVRLCPNCHPWLHDHRKAKLHPENKCHMCHIHRIFTRIARSWGLTMDLPWNQGNRTVWRRRSACAWCYLACLRAMNIAMEALNQLFSGDRIGFLMGCIVCLHIKSYRYIDIYICIIYIYKYMATVIFGSIEKWEIPQNCNVKRKAMEKLWLTIKFGATTRKS